MELMKVYVLATVLDPRFKVRVFTSASSTAMARQMVIEEYELMDENDSPPSEKRRRLVDDNQGLSSSANSSTLWTLIDKMVDESNTDQEESESQSSAENTVDSYLREPVPSRKSDPL